MLLASRVLGASIDFTSHQIQRCVPARPRPSKNPAGEILK